MYLILLYVVYTEVFYTLPSTTGYTGYYCCGRYYSGGRNNYGRYYQHCRDNESPYDISECKNYCDQDQNCRGYDTYTGSGSSYGRCYFYTTSSSCPSGFSMRYGQYNNYFYSYVGSSYCGGGSSSYSGCFVK